ncbi:ketoacyl-ACP synthase III [Niallia sp. NCCP-28]|uniref:ketoacyl-ACP synthase III n=1 Tax=Niallia sp. NCCP-28 TaxID=2934712 RepID=UPI0020843F5A|nr:ketoacyl-ACP synthase III [Niallia sp. NCCP-28]GKU82889.1 3-oxoacyl-[acyl-carrier-protein] synthase 3 protein 2 [Niallia sp. NCCP-28]
MLTSKARVTAIGSYVPEKKITNEDLERIVETNNDWIIQRTGIKERRMAEENEFTSDLAYMAVLDLMKRYSKPIEDVEMIIVCTMTPDFKTPSVAAIVQGKLGIKNAGTIDLNAACAGFTYGLHVANGLITAGLNKKILVIGAEALTKITDYEDRTSCILFGDGASAVLVEYDEKNPSFLSFFLDSRGEAGKNLYATSISEQMDGIILKADGNIVQNGREVYKWAVSTVPKGMKAVANNGGIDLLDVDWFVPHSANLRMIESICEKSGYPLEKTLVSLIDYGNTSSATIPLAMDLAVKAGKLKTKDKLLLFGFGGGLTQAGLLIEWNI